MPKRLTKTDLITSTEAARLLGVSATTLRQREAPDKRSIAIYDGILRVYWTSFPNGERRFSRKEIEALLAARR